jgi:hypothetical protein
MGYNIVQVVIWILEIRGHIPQFGNNHPLRHNASADPSINLARLLAGFAVGVGLFALALWVAVWLAIRLL